MADVFISYSKEHRPLTERVAALLNGKESVGPDGKSKRITVWWDQSLTSGDVFPREITEQIDKAGAVVVIWTLGAVASDWVCAEAQRGAPQKKLVPLRDPSVARNRIPLPFSVFHIDDANNDDAIVASVIKRLGGTASEDVGAFAAEQRSLLDPKAEPPLPRTAKINPALLLQAKHRVTEFVDIDGRRRDLINWAGSADNQNPTAGADVAIWAIVVCFTPATALVAEVGDWTAFSSGRSLAASTFPTRANPAMIAPERRGNRQIDDGN